MGGAQPGSQNQILQQTRLQQHIELALCFKKPLICPGVRKTKKHIKTKRKTKHKQSKTHHKTYAGGLQTPCAISPSLSSACQPCPRRRVHQVWLGFGFPVSASEPWRGDCKSVVCAFIPVECVGVCVWVPLASLGHAASPPKSRCGILFSFGRFVLMAGFVFVYLFFIVSFVFFCTATSFGPEIVTSPPPPLHGFRPKR